MTQHTPESTFLHILFATLQARNCRYAVMRNYETLPYSANGSDLDLLVAPDQGALTKTLILDCIQQAGGAPIGIAESTGFFKIYALGKNPGTSGPWWGLRIDVNVGLFFKGQRLLDDSNSIPTRLLHNISVLDDGLAGVLGVLKEVLNNGRYPERYALAARNAVREDWPSIESLLSPMGGGALKPLRSLLLSETKPEKLADECHRVRSRLIRRSFLRSPFISLWQRAKYEWSKVKRYLKPSGIVIAILGVDGAGKSTIIHAIKPALDSATHNATIIKHLRPGLLPPLARFKGKSSIADDTAQNPHGSSPSGTLGSLARLAYLTLDYILGYWLIIRPQIAKQPTVVVFDRYAYDLAIDSRRFRIALPKSIIDCFVKLIPQPNIIICLHGSAATFIARKKELTLIEIQRQIADLELFAQKNSRAILVNAENSIEEIKNIVLATFINEPSRHH